MRVGQIVTYVYGAGQVSDGLIHAIVDVGPSRFKVLDLRVAGHLVRSVPHATDRVAGRGFWIVPGTPLPPDVAVITDSPVRRVRRPPAPGSDLP